MAGGNRYKHRSLGGGLVPNNQQEPANRFYATPPEEPSLLEKALQLAQALGDSSSEYTAKANADPGNRLSPFGAVPTQFVKDSAKHLWDEKFGLVPAKKAWDSGTTLADILSGKEQSTPFASVQGTQIAGDAANNAGLAALDASTLIPGMGIVPKMGRGAGRASAASPNSLADILRPQNERMALDARFNKIKGPANDTPEWASFPNNYDPRIADTPGLPGDWLSSPEGRDYLAQQMRFYPNEPEKALMLARNRSALLHMMEDASFSPPKNAADEYAQGLRAFRETGTPESDALQYMKGHPGEPGAFDPLNPPPSSNADLSGEARGLSESIWNQRTDISPDVKKYTNALVKQKTEPPAPPSATVLPFGKPQSPTTLGMGFPFSGKDGEKPLLSALMDAMRGKGKDAPLNPQASAPTSLDDIFTGAPTQARPDPAPFSPQQQAYIAQNQLADDFDLSAPTAFERMENASQAMTQKPLGYDDWSPEWRAAYDKGLPMDTASRMARAREQGFNVDERLFHGTRADFDAFDVKRSGSNMGAKNEPAVFLTPEPYAADRFAAQTILRDEFSEGQTTLPLFTRGKTKNIDWRIRDYQEGNVPASLALAKMQGNDAVRFSNIRDRTKGINSDQIAIFDPANIRSTSAAFDPANARRPTLLGMGAKYTPEDATRGNAKPTGLGMSTFDSPGLPPQALPATQQPTSLADLIAQSLKRPDDIPEGDWANIMGGVQKQNEDLAGMMNGGLFSNIEFGGVARPSGATTLKSQGADFGVSVDTIPEDRLSGFIGHSHPHVVEDGLGNQYPAGLSLPDLQAILAMRDSPFPDARGITSLEPQGGFGYAVGNPKAPKLEQDEWRNLMSALNESAEPLAPGLNFSVPGTRGLDASVREMGDAIAPRALGEALRRTNMIEQFGYKAGTSAQTETLAKYKPAIDAGADAAEKSLRSILKARGYTDGQIAALIAQYGSIGAAMGALGYGAQQKGAPVSQSAF